MITIQKSPTADTRTCDFANTSKETLLASSHMHIRDVREALQYFSRLIAVALQNHDTDKITDIDGFHRDFVTGFKQTTWWDAHRKLNRHHLNVDDGIPVDVNLIDVLDYIADCTMAGMARSGSVYDITLPNDVLQRAFANTAALLKSNVQVATEAPRERLCGACDRPESEHSLESTHVFQRAPRIATGNPASSPEIGSLPSAAYKDGPS